MKEGFIYFIADPEDEYLKVGFAKDVFKRLKGLEVSTPHRLKVYGSYKANAREEKELHERFKHLRVRGEWFRPGEDLIDFILDLKDAGRLVTIEEHIENYYKSNNV